MVQRKERRCVQPIAAVNEKKMIMDVLIFCTHHTGSLRAEENTRAEYGNRLEGSGTGTEATCVHPLPKGVMNGTGIDSSRRRSKLCDAHACERIETAVTACDSANNACPFFPGGREIIHRGFPDPPAFKGSGEEIRAGFRRVRDGIIRWTGTGFGSADA